MGQRRRVTISFSFWSSSVVEWGIVALVVLAIGGGFGQQYRSLQGQAEFAMVQSTMGSLRTALVLDFVQRRVQGKPEDVAQVQRNPFKLLQGAPANYAGEFSMAQVAEVTPGDWVFDAACVCIGYRPLNPQWLEPSADPAVLWFRVSGAVGPMQLTAMHAYRWQGQVVN